MAKKLRLTLPRFLIDQKAASTTAGLRYSFLKDPIASGQLRTVVKILALFLQSPPMQPSPNKIILPPELAY
jgi:hypothetical protein